MKLKSSKKGYVYAGEAESADPKCTFVYEKMPVVKLLSKQKIDLIMTAVVSTREKNTLNGLPEKRIIKRADLKTGKTAESGTVGKPMQRRGIQIQREQCRTGARESLRQQSIGILR